MVERQEPPETLLTMLSKAEKDILKVMKLLGVMLRPRASSTRTHATVFVYTTDACGAESDTRFSCQTFDFVPPLEMEINGASSTVSVGCWCWVLGAGCWVLDQGCGWVRE